MRNVQSNPDTTLRRLDTGARNVELAPSAEPRVALAPVAGGGEPSIAALNDRLQGWLDEGGSPTDAVFRGLLAQRDDAVTRFTGNPDPSPYDPAIAAVAQRAGTTYNAAVDTRNLRAAPGDAPAPRVREMPWESASLEAKVEGLIADGLSPPAAAVVAMTSRDLAGTGTATRARTDLVDPDGGRDFARFATGAGDEIATWGAGGTDPGTVTYRSDAGRIDVTMDGDTLVISDGTAAGTRRIDPANADRIVIEGGAGDDLIVVDPAVTASLQIAGGAGDDFIFGGGGNDVIDGGSGVDTILGGDGDDIVVGGRGDDNLEGNGGADVLLGGAGNDYASGGEGVDFVAGGGGRDTLYGGGGADFLFGGTGADYLDAGRGDDTAFGGHGDDVVSGGAGDDRLFGGRGADRLVGASGEDSYGPPDAGDHVIAESDESVRASARGGATVERVDIDPTLGSSITFDPGSRDEFVDRVGDDVETLRATNAGQSMLGTLDATAASTGNSVTLAELFGVDNGFAIPLGDEAAFTRQPGGPAVPGVDAVVAYNLSTNIPLPGAGATPPVVILFHELAHAHNFTSGTLAAGDYRNGVDVADTAPIDQLPDGTLVYLSNAERQAVGLPIDHDGDPRTPERIVPGHRFDMTENGLRVELGLAPRTSYLEPQAIRWLGGAR